MGAIDLSGGTGTTNIITGGNDAPTAVDDNASFGEDDGSSVLDVVGNDTDPDTNDPLSVDSVDTTGTIGTVNLGGGTVEIGEGEYLMQDSLTCAPMSG